MEHAATTAKNALRLFSVTFVSSVALGAIFFAAREHFFVM
jgi:hypothetical protein